MQAQQLEVKLFAKAPGDFDQAALIPVFHRWIQQDRLGDALLIDVADYRHVPDGPGVMIIGDGVQWKLDGDRGELGIAFARKRDAIGDLHTKLAEAFDLATKAADALEDEPSLAGALRFDRNHGQVTIMSRLVARNDDACYAEAAPIIQAFVSARHNGATVNVDRSNADPREPLAIRFQVGT